MCSKAASRGSGLHPPAAQLGSRPAPQRCAGLPRARLVEKRWTGAFAGHEGACGFLGARPGSKAERIGREHQALSHGFVKSALESFVDSDDEENSEEEEEDESDLQLDELESEGGLQPGCLPAMKHGSCNLFACWGARGVHRSEARPFRQA